MVGGRILVTGAGGFVGSHLLPRLKHSFPEVELHAAGRGQKESDSTCCWHELDICSKKSVEQLVSDLAPEVIIHLAAQSSVPLSFRQPELTWKVNLDGALNLFGALERLPTPPLLLHIGSSDMYGDSFKASGRIDENVILQPLNPYAASKAAADLAAFQLAKTSNVKVLRVRPFNHIGAGQADVFVVPSFARQIAEVELGLREEIQVGDLTAQRDFMHVSDVVSAYVAMIENAAQFESGAAVNVCSGVAVSIDYILKELLALAHTDISVVQDSSRMRKSDIARVLGSHDFLSKKTGWEPSVNLINALEDVLEYWRGQLS